MSDFLKVQPSSWLISAGVGSRARVQAAVGSGARVFEGEGWRLAVTGSDHVLPVRLTEQGAGGITAVFGDPAEAGSRVDVDLAGRSLTVRRDPFGIQAVVFAQGADWVLAGSSVRLVAAALDGARPSAALDPAALHGYLSFSYVPVPVTTDSRVRAVPAGGVRRLRIGHLSSTASNIAPDHSCSSPDKLQPDKDGSPAAQPATLDDVDQAWRKVPPFAGSEENAVAELAALLRAAVLRRLGHERTAGVFLSGGLDSSLVAALLVEAGARVIAYSLDFGPPFNQELDAARRVAAHLRIPLRVVPAGAGAIKRALPLTAAALDQPFGDAVTAPLWLLGEAAARDVAVVFNGEGGDQLFGGWANKPMVAAELYQEPGYDRERAYLATFHRFIGVFDRLYTPATASLLQQCDPGMWVRPWLNAEGYPSLLHLLRAANLGLKGAQNIAPRACQLAAAHGLRLHMPFFDQALTTWSFSLPPQWLLAGACEKWLLKRVAEPLLPAATVWQDKRGMGVPAAAWLSGPLHRDSGRLLSGRALRRDGLFSVRYVDELRRGEDNPGEFRSRRSAERLWTLLMWQLWWQRMR